MSEEDLRPFFIHPSARVLSALDLEPFITPLVHATHILSYLSPEAMQGVGGCEAYKWISNYASNRAHELQSILYGTQLSYDTGMDASERASILRRHAPPGPARG